MLRRHASTLTAQLFPSFGMDASEWRLSFDTSEVAALQENVDALFTRWRELWSAGGIDLYTLQTKIGLPQVPQEYRGRFVGGKDDDLPSEDSEEAKGLRQWFRAKTSPESNRGSFASFPSGPFVVGRGEGSDMALHLNTERHLHQLLDANGDLTDTNRLAYRETISRVVANMPPAAHAAILKTVKRLAAFNNVQRLREYAERVQPPGTKINPDLMGRWMADRGEMIVDGGSPTAKHPWHKHHHAWRDVIYAHELTHAIDTSHHPPISTTKRWQVAYEEEINKPDAPLTPYALKSPAEGFAELGRVIYTSANREKAVENYKRQFPKCFAILEENKLL